MEGKGRETKKVWTVSVNEKRKEIRKYGVDKEEEVARVPCTEVWRERVGRDFGHRIS